MSIKPASLPRWASVDTINGTTLQNNVIEPAEAKKDLGWDYLEKPARNYMNWVQRTSYLNLEYLINEVDQFAPHESDPPAMDMAVDSGRVFSAGAVTPKTTQTTSTFTAPVTNPRIDRVVIDEATGVISIIAGAEAGSPTAPTITNGKRPICQILFATSTTEITDSMITDERSAALVAGMLSENETVTGQWRFNDGLTQFGSTAPGDTWIAGYNVLELGAKSNLIGNDSATMISENAYDDAVWKYQNTDPASLITMTSGVFTLDVAASGTADTAITWSTAIRAENDGIVKGLGGNWLISPDSVNITPNYSLVIYKDASAAAYIQIANSTTGATTGDGFKIGIDASENALLENDENTDMKFITNNLLEMTIDASSRGVFLGAATGDGQGAGTLNATGYYVDGTKISSTAVSGYYNANGITIHDDIAHATTLDVDAIIGGAWESVGPTGSGATNIWTALDDMPSTVQAVIIKVDNEITGSTNAARYVSELSARRTGSSIGVSSASRISITEFYNRSGSAEQSREMNEVTIPVDSSGRFDLYYALSGTTPTERVELALVGWIE